MHGARSGVHHLQAPRMIHIPDSKLSAAPVRGHLPPNMARPARASCRLGQTSPPHAGCLRALLGSHACALRRFRDTAVARASDDFYPREEASSSPHVGACAFNSVFLSALVQPDWDMFHSQHPAAELHALARAVSGGPVYVSDYPGKHDFDLLRCAGRRPARAPSSAVSL